MSIGLGAANSRSKMPENSGGPAGVTRKLSNAQQTGGRPNFDRRQVGFLLAQLDVAADFHADALSVLLGWTTHCHMSSVNSLSEGNFDFSFRLSKKRNVSTE